MKKSKKILIPLFYKKKPRRPLSKKQKGLLKFTLQKFLFKKEKVQNSKKRFLEIGFGYGENIIHLSKKNGDKLIIGCEIYEPGIANLVSKIESENLKNIYIFPENIFSLLSKLKKNSIEKIFILYPDPWPKKKHYKRRLISSVFLNKINSVLKTNGIVFVSTDSEDYLKVILNNFLLNKNFLWVNKKISNCYKRPKDLIETKYEKKANIKNNKKYFLKFKKIC
ncbi:MAG: tRNA (guanosine(46)-N7)-methyltransferase TrmB [Alphaproteobacteria bacterium]|nr:tRNA (guanosine(46)-N7)-methyltransferase TrmB [Alphaproteobacteria bacterium]